MDYLKKLLKKRDFPFGGLFGYATILMMIMFLVSYFSDDLKAMVTSVFGISMLGLSIIDQRQKKINAQLIEEIKKLQEHSPYREPGWRSGQSTSRSG